MDGWQAIRLDFMQPNTLEPAVLFVRPRHILR